jgi:hypothetical protein
MKPSILITLSSWHKAPQILSFSILLCLLSACTSNPSNFSNDQGKTFDADSAYCVQLRQKISNPFHDMDTYDHDTDVQKAIVEEMNTSISKTDTITAMYNKDCESLSAYNARKKAEEFTFGKSKNNGDGKNKR